MKANEMNSINPQNPLIGIIMWLAGCFLYFIGSAIVKDFLQEASFILACGASGLAIMHYWIVDWRKKNGDK